MKKGFEKLLSILLAVVTLFFVIVLLLLMSGSVDAAEVQTPLVKGFLITLACVYFASIAGVILLAFRDTETVAAVLLFSDKSSSAKTTLGVIRRLVRDNAKLLMGIRATRVALMVEENNALRMKVAVRITNTEVEKAVDNLRCLLLDSLRTVLGLRFSAIDFKITALKPQYVPSVEHAAVNAAELKEKRDKDEAALEAAEKAKEVAAKTAAAKQVGAEAATAARPAAVTKPAPAKAEPTAVAAVPKEVVAPAQEARVTTKEEQKAPEPAKPEPKPAAKEEPRPEPKTVVKEEPKPAVPPVPKPQAKQEEAGAPESLEEALAAAESNELEALLENPEVSPDDIAAIVAELNKRK